MIKKFFDHKLWVILATVLSLLMLVFIAAGLDELRFEPGRPPAREETAPVQLSMEKVVQEIVDIPIWKQLAFWGMLLLMVLLFASLLTPEMRKRLIRYFLRVAFIGLAVFFLFKNYRELFTVLNLGSAAVVEKGGPPAGEYVPESFTPPQVSSSLLYIVSLGVILALVVTGYLAGRWWMRQRSHQKEARSLENLAEIARTSLADISSGRRWEDAVIRCYMRMNDVVESRRGLHRQKELTPSEFAARLEASGLPGEAVRKLTHLFEAARYGARQSSRDESVDAVACLNSILYACGVTE
jgi:hypothetical protein